MKIEMTYIYREGRGGGGGLITVALYVRVYVEELIDAFLNVGSCRKEIRRERRKYN